MMQQYLELEEQQAKVEGNNAKVQAIRQVLRTMKKHPAPTTIISTLHDIFQQQGTWDPTISGSLADRSMKANEILHEAGQVGQKWMQLLQSFHAKYLPVNPLFKL